MTAVILVQYSALPTELSSQLAAVKLNVVVLV